MSTTLIVPGLGGSGPDHWQSWWLATDRDAVRVEQDDWETPDPTAWSAKIADSLRQATAPVWIVAHSFGCLAAVLATTRNPDVVAGALLVAPADPQKFSVEPLLPKVQLPFPSLLVASSNDPWIKFMTAALWAQRWGSRLINIGNAGHVNAESGFGPWVEGRVMFSALTRSQEDWPSGDVYGEIRLPESSPAHSHLV